MIKTIDDFNFKGKRVILRIDINSEIKNGKPVLSDRIIQHAKTINELRKKGAKVVILAHQGRRGDNDFISLEQHVSLLNKFTRVDFIDDIIGEKAIEKIGKLKEGEALLLENIRFLEDEFNLKENNEMVKVLSNLSDIYVNDSFSVSHREQASIILFPKRLKSCIGRVMQKEIESLDEIRGKEALYILGGAKIEEIMPLIKDNKILSTGVFSLLCLSASGVDLGLENVRVKKEKDKMEDIKKSLKNIEVPVDLAIDKNGERVEISVDELPQDYRILDIAENTINLYCHRIKKAEAIFMKGSVGYAENAKFSRGTKKILQAIESARGFTVVAGGHTTTELRKFKINKNNIDYVSLSGGALLEYMAGKKLPGIEAIKRGIK